jgi:hypothetical protein
LKISSDVFAASCHAVKPAPVYLVAGHYRTVRGGPDADWSIELVPSPEPNLTQSGHDLSAVWIVTVAGWYELLQHSFEEGGINPSSHQD